MVLQRRRCYFMALVKGNITRLFCWVSAVPMAARVSNVEGQKAKPGNFLLMHAMGPNVAGVIGSAIAAGGLLPLVIIGVVKDGKNPLKITDNYFA